MRFLMRTSCALMVVPFTYRSHVSRKLSGWKSNTNTIIFICSLTVSPNFQQQWDSQAFSVDEATAVCSMYRYLQYRARCVIDSAEAGRLSEFEKLIDRTKTKKNYSYNTSQAARYTLKIAPLGDNNFWTEIIYHVSVRVMQWSHLLRYRSEAYVTGCEMHKLISS